jgi:dTDP-4-dehydrorhamnose reductase
MPLDRAAVLALISIDHTFVRLPPMFLLVGGDSEIGRAVAADMGARQRVLVTTRRARQARDERIRLDLAGDLDRWEPPADITGACICAAVARLADCAADPAASARVNVIGTLAVVERLLARDVHVVFLSTNQVFDGLTPQVRADAPTSPVSEYGRQKARTEAALRAEMERGAPVAILRLSKVISPQTALLRDWTAALAAGKPIRAFHDMTMAPVPAVTVASAIEALMSDRASGVFQLAGPRDVAYTEVGRFLAERLGADRSLVESVSVASAGLPAGVAPPHTTLDSAALKARHGIVVADPRQVLGSIMQEVGTGY